MNFLYKLFNKLGRRLYSGSVLPVRRLGKQFYSPLQLDSKELKRLAIVKVANFFATATLFFMVAGLIPNLLRLTFSMPISWTVFAYWGAVGIGVAFVPILHFICWMTYGYTQEEVDRFVELDEQMEELRRQEEETMEQLNELRKNMADALASQNGGIILEALPLDEAEDAEFSVPSSTGIPKDKLH